MQISTHRSHVSRASRPANAGSEKPTLNEPIDGWDPSQSAGLAKFAPYSMVVIGGAAGVIAGMADGVGGAVAGAVAVGTAGATLVTVGSALAEMKGARPNYGRNALIGAGLGAAIGVAAGSMLSSGLAGVGLGVAGAFGAGFGMHIIQDS